MKCTSPCVPGCDNEATHELLAMNGSHLGFNCTEHITPLMGMKNGKLDYKSTPLETTVAAE